MIVLPGFVDTHRHVWQTQLRTLAADWSLFDYLVRMRSIYSAFYTPQMPISAIIGRAGSGQRRRNDLCRPQSHGQFSRPCRLLINGLDHAGIGRLCYGFFVNPSPDGPELRHPAGAMRTFAVSAASV